MQSRLLQRPFLYSGFLLLFLASVISAALSAFSVGQTDRLNKAPFYKTYKKQAIAENNACLHLPIAFHETMKSEFFFNGRDHVLQPVIDAMNAFLDSLAWTRTASAIPLQEKDAPFIYVGSAIGEGAPPEAEMELMDHDKYPPMVIHMRKPSSAWQAAFREHTSSLSAEYTVYLTLGFAEYPKADKGFFGKKVVLGTGYEVPVKFLSAEDTPVEVLQLTGALLDREGNIVRAGAEGIISRDTPFWVQIFEFKKSIDDKTLGQLLYNERRTDLPGAPLTWQVSLRNLVAQLLNRPALVL